MELERSIVECINCPPWTSALMRGVATATPGAIRLGPAMFRHARADRINLAVAYSGILRVMNLCTTVVGSTGLYFAAFTSRTIGFVCFLIVFVAECVVVPWLGRQRRVRPASTLWDLNSEDRPQDIGVPSHVPIVRGDTQAIARVSDAIVLGGAGCLPYLSKVRYPLQRVSIAIGALLIAYVRGPVPHWAVPLAMAWILLLVACFDRAEGVSTLKHVWYRVSAGRLEVLQCRLWSRSTAVVRCISLMDSDIVVDFESGVVQIGQGTTTMARQHLGLERLDDPYGFAGAVLVAAAAPAPGPDLPSDVPL